MNRKHYHFGSNSPGYLPVGDVGTTRTFKDAIRASSADACRVLDEDPWWSEEPTARHELCRAGLSKPHKSGSRGFYTVTPSSGSDEVFWVSDPCDCEEGETDLADR